MSTGAEQYCLVLYVLRSVSIHLTVGVCVCGLQRNLTTRYHWRQVTANAILNHVRAAL